MNNPDQWELLQKRPELIKKAVEELLRYDGSVKSTVRWAKEDIMISDKLIKKGDRLLVSLSGANATPCSFRP